MALPRTTSNSSDELAATVAGLKSRLNELETANGFYGPPVGSIIDYIGLVAPSGWTLLDGSTIANGRTLYPALWDVLPPTFKSGNNIITPDTRGRVLVHRSASGTLSTNVGTTGGLEEVILTSAQMPVHNHAMAHTHFNRTYSITETSSFFSGGIGPALTDVTLNSVTNGEQTGGVSTPNTSDAGGSGSPATTQAHTNLQPYMIVLKIMKLA